MRNAAAFQSRYIKVGTFRMKFAETGQRQIGNIELQIVRTAAAALTSAVSDALGGVLFNRTPKRRQHEAEFRVERHVLVAHAHLALDTTAGE